MNQMTKSKQKQPNILVIWGDDIGITNLSCYSHGLMGYQTPNIDRIAKEGMMFTDSYGEQSCTAGRSSFITGQSVYRTGLSKVGMPGAPVGMNEKIVTIAALLKEQGYATGQFGKNHLGDLNHMLPTNHGFDEFFGNSAVFMGDGTWKASKHIQFGLEPVWRLFDIVKDPSETTNVANQNPQILEPMVEYYDKWANETGIIPPNPEEFAVQGIGPTGGKVPTTSD